MATPLQSALARDAWASFQSLPSPADEPRACHPPHPFRNATVDMRNLSAVTRVQFFAKLRKRWRCESPSEKQHLVRLQQAASAHGRTLTLVQIGANAGGTGKSREANEWIGDLVRRYKWRAALVEPVPFLFEAARELRPRDRRRPSERPPACCPCKPHGRRHRWQMPVPCGQRELHASGRQR